MVQATISEAAAPHFRSWLPKLFLRLLTQIELSDLSTTLAKQFFDKLHDKLLVDGKEVAFYHRH